MDAHAGLPRGGCDDGDAARARASQLPAARAARGPGARSGPRAGATGRQRRGSTSPRRRRRRPSRSSAAGAASSSRARAATRASSTVAERAGWPVLADPLSGGRRGDAAVAHYDALLRDAAFVAAHRPDVVLRAGDLPTSKPLRAWLVGLCGRRARRVRAAVGVVGPRRDALAAAARAPRDAAAGRGRDGSTPGGRPTPGSRRRSRRCSATTWASRRSRGRCVATLPADATLVVASSMPVRDVESFAPVRSDPPRVLSNRGANGIDGTVSTAYGVASVSDGPVVLLIGDVALLHDAGGLLAGRRLGLDLDIVLINNDGGGIFEFLPVAGEQRLLRGARRDARTASTSPTSRRSTGARTSVSTTSRPSARRSGAAAPASSRSAPTGRRTSRCTVVRPRRRCGAIA